jgi:glycogen debranching enzyme
MTKFPVPSVPTGSAWFSEHRYWQGPTWLNMNWLITDGLRRYGFDDKADKIIASSLEMVKKSGFSEYFSPLNGSPAGAENFSWSAAVILDFLSR